MEASYSSNADFTEKVGNPADVENIMKPAVKRDGTVLMGSWQYVGTEPLYAPAGGIISNMRDMSTWIQFRLNSGMKNGQQRVRARFLLCMTASRKQMRCLVPLTALKCHFGSRPTALTS